MKIIVVGGGAAGFFAAINIATKNPHAQITILEKSGKLLSKVKISGGGRCNVTNGRSNPAELVKFYPRGGKKLFDAFKQFGSAEMIQWLANHQVPTKTEEDLRVFPYSNSSQSIINCFLSEAKKLGITVKLNEAVTSFDQSDNGWKLTTTATTYTADKVIYSPGSSPASLELLKPLSLKINPQVPSLFTFNIKDARIADLPGLSFEKVKIRVVKSKLLEEGPLLITHWGLSGPAVLKLSSWGAQDLKKLNYQFKILINFLPEISTEDISLGLSELRTHPNRKIHSYCPFNLPKRFWKRLCEIVGIYENQTCEELSKKHINKLSEELSQGLYEVNGKSTFKEEFVTCGGVALSEINLKSFESKNYPGLYLAGEVIDIDGLTGGFNFQACWSAGWLISESLSS